MAKIYYSDVETAARLGISLAELANYVRDGKIRSFQDGAKKMFKVEEVDKLSGGPAAGEIELSPVEGDAGISLSEADKPRPAGKEDTVITAEGISIFDDEDLQIEAADPMAKTQIAPTLDEQVSIEGVGSGSGLLDLTRESDDTSLGEVLEHIGEPGPGDIGSGLGGDEISQPGYAASPAAEVALAAPVFVEIVDAATGAFNGIVVGLAIVMLIASAVAMGILTRDGSEFSQSLRENLIAALGVGLAVAIAAAVIGYMMGKSAAQRQAAMQKV